MFKLYYEKYSDKENKTETPDIDDGSSQVANLIHFLGKSKLELESELLNKKINEQSEYEIHLQRLEAQIREHIRVGLV